MVGVNKVILIGNLGKNPEIITFQQEREDGSMGVVKKATFPLATTEVHKNKDGERVEQTDWHNIVCWRGLAEIAEKLLRKGTQVFIEGKLQSRSWEDREGNRRYITEVVADNFTVLGNRNRQEDGNPSSESFNDSLTPETAQMGDLPF